MKRRIAIAALITAGLLGSSAGCGVGNNTKYKCIEKSTGKTVKGSKCKGAKA